MTLNRTSLGAKVRGAMGRGLFPLGSRVPPIPPSAAESELLQYELIPHRVKVRPKVQKGPVGAQSRKGRN